MWVSRGIGDEAYEPGVTLLGEAPLRYVTARNVMLCAVLFAAACGDADESGSADEGRCTPGETVCNGMSGFAVCQDDGIFGPQTLCAADAECREGACRAVAATQEFCEPCSSNAQCDNGLCYGKDRAKEWCIVPCTDDGDCEPTARCLPVSNGQGAFWDTYCVPKELSCQVPPRGDVGAACARNQECISELCVEGRCSQLCERGLDCPSGFSCVPQGQGADVVSSCRAEDRGGAVGETCDPTGGGGDCASGLCVDGTDGGAATCTQICTEDSDCPGDARCAPAEIPSPDAPTLTASVCRRPLTPSCKPTNGGVELCDTLDNDCDDQVDEGGVCDARSAVVTTVNLGTVELAGTGQTSTLFEMVLPDDVVSFTIVAEGLGASFGQLAALIDPTGANVIEQMKPYAFDDTLAVQVPNSSDIPLRGGRWQFALVNFFAQTTAEVSVIVKTGALEVEHDAKLNVFFAGTQVDARSAPTDPAFQELTREVAEVYRRAGVRLDTEDVGYYDVANPEFAFIDTTDGFDSELRRLFAESAIADDDGRINVFFVRTISSGTPGFITLGVAGGIPGPPGVNGTRSSGVVVGLDSFGANSLPRRITEIAGVWAHEMGHFMGLFHTSEQTGRSFDPLPDTPECPESADGDGDGFVLARECGAERGASNLMFWEANPLAQDISADQSEVLRRNPLSK